MRRGFLLDKHKRKKEPSGTKSNVQAQVSDWRPIVKAESDQPINFYRAELKYGKVEDTSLPTDFTPKWNITIDAERGLVKSDRKTLVLVTVPPKGSKMAADENDHSEWITLEATKPRVFDAPGFPKPVPKPVGGVPTCEVKTTTNMGMGVFATRDIKLGELVFAERPLLVKPVNANALELFVPKGTKYNGFIFREEEKVLEAAMSRMSLANQAAFKALANSHTEDGSGPLTGIIRTNGYGVSAIYDGPGAEATDDACRYSAVGNIASRINHSCMANVFRGFDMAAFCFTFKACQDIKAGEQLFYSYCAPEANVAARQRQLAPYGIVCECRSCVTSTPERDKFRKEYIEKTKEYGALNTQAHQQRNHTWPNKEEFQQVLKFQTMAIEEGLNVQPEYQHVLAAIMLWYANEGARSKIEETLVMMQKNTALFAKAQY